MLGAGETVLNIQHLIPNARLICPRGAGVAHLFGKEEVTGPNPVVGSTSSCCVVVSGQPCPETEVRPEFRLRDELEQGTSVSKGGNQDGKGAV